MRNIFIFLVLIPAIFSCKNKSGSEPKPDDKNLQTRVVTQNLTQPWSVTWGSDNFLWITERGGRLLRINPETGTLQNLLNVPGVVQRGEGGLLGFAFHPDFNATPKIYIVYDYMKNGIYTGKVMSYDYVNSNLSNPQIILDDIPAANNHNGSRIAVGPDKKLYISTGDATQQSEAQNKASLSGKILRLNLDGTIPSDNPIANSPVFSLGHRNPQGLVFINDKLFSSEHGNTTDDEMNIIAAGRNYGWPNVEGKCEGADASFCQQNNIAEPIYTWTPTIAPSGITYYNRDAISQWKNSVLMASLKASRLYQLKLNDTQTGITSVTEFYTNEYGRLRDVCVAPDGRVFVITGNGSNDKLVEIKGQ